MADRMSEVRRQIVSETGGGGTYTLISGEADYDILVIGLSLQANNAQRLTLQDSVASLLDVIFLAATVSFQQFLLPESNGGWLRCASGSDLDMVLLDAAAVRGTILYRMIPSGMEL
jgi:hypothetical protein